MALAEYYDRAALAAAQVISGFDSEAFRLVVEQTAVGISFDRQTCESPEGQALLDLAVRLLARLYPTIAIVGEPDCSEYAAHLRDVAVSINPRLDFVETAPIGISVGQAAPTFERTIYAGSHEWTALISDASPQGTTDSAIPFGAGAAACLAVATIFREVLLDDSSAPIDISFSCLDGTAPVDPPAVPGGGWRIAEPAVLVGCGAIGQACVWALARSPLRGEIYLVDPQKIELSNVQRYVLTRRRDEEQLKTTLAAAALDGDVVPREFPGTWGEFTEKHGYAWPTVLVAVDSAEQRRAVQSALPGWIVNAWTQPGDLGVSTHAFSNGACLACLYLPPGTTANEDSLVANALGIPAEIREVRELLHTRRPVGASLLDAVAVGLGVARDTLNDFEGLSIRQLYVEGICGGRVLPLGASGVPRADVHVPLAHQSALAGVLLAARLARHAAELDSDSTEVTRLDVLREPGIFPTQLAQKDPRGICICQDADYQAAYDEKWRNNPVP